LQSLQVVYYYQIAVSSLMSSVYECSVCFVFCMTGGSWLLRNITCWISECTTESFTSWWFLWCSTSSAWQAASCDVRVWWYVDSGSCVWSTQVCRISSRLQSDAWLPCCW